MTPDEAIKKLEKEMGGKKQAPFARELGVTQQELNDSLRGKRFMPEKISERLGLEDLGKVYGVKGK